MSAGQRLAAKALRLLLACLIAGGALSPAPSALAALVKPASSGLAYSLRQQVARANSSELLSVRFRHDPSVCRLAKAHAFTALELSKVVGLPVLGPPWRPADRNLTTASAGTRSFLGATAAPERPFYDQGSSVTIAGRATDRDAFPVPNATVAVHVLSGGFDRRLSAMTDGAGNYTAVFFPLPDEGGLYTVAASHPDVVTHASQSSFTIVSFGFNYRDYTVQLAQNSTGQVGRTSGKRDGRRVIVSPPAVVSLHEPFLGDMLSSCGPGEQPYSRPG